MKRPARLGLLILIPLLWIWLAVSFAAHEVFIVLDHAQAANQHIQTLQQDLKDINLQNNLGDSTALQEQLRKIQNQFDDLGGDLNYFDNEMSRFQGMVEVAKIVTPFRADLETAQYLLKSGQIFMQAGDLAFNTAQTAVTNINFSNISIAGLDNPDLADSNTISTTLSSTSDGTQGSLIAPEKLNEIQANLDEVRQLMTQGIGSFNRVPYTQLKQDGSTARAVDQLRNQLANLSSGLDQANTVIGVLRRALGYDEPANYVVMVQDADELRANGGFAGNYILLTFWKGQLVNFLFDNSYKPDDAIQATTVIPVPQPYFDWWGQNNSSLRYSFGLRDSTSLAPDWPDTSRIMQSLLLQEQISGNLTGMLALNFGLIKSLLQITGPVYVTSLPDYNHEEVNADNFTERIHYHQSLDEQQKGLSSLQRKKFTRYLAAEVLAAIKKLPKNKLADVGKAFLNSLDQKDLLLYLADPTAEKVLDNLGWTGRINQSKSGLTIPTNSDYFYFVDDNVAANKTNAVIKQQVNDTISFNPDGSTTHRTTLNYDYWGQLPEYDRRSRTDHIAYSRFYLPQASQILVRNGFDDQSGIVQQYGRDVWGQLLTVPASQKRTCEFDWQTPAYFGLHQTADTTTYDLNIQRQPAANFEYHITLKPPDGMKIVAVSGAQNQINNSDGSVQILNGLLNTDWHVKVNFASK